MTQMNASLLLQNITSILYYKLGVPEEAYVT